LPQWLAWGSYFVLAGLTVSSRNSDSDKDPGGTDSARVRLLLTLGLILVGLGIAAVGIEGVRHLRLTMFQPFRMATLARGLALVLAADRILRLWENHGLAGKVRAGILVVGLAGDWMFVVAVAVEVVATVAEGLAAWLGRWSTLATVPPLAALIVGLVFLDRHDTEQGEWALMAAVVGVPAWVGLNQVARLEWNRRRLSLAFASAWVVPLTALVSPPLIGIESGNRLVVSTSERCRIWPVPLDEVERLAVWARDHTPADATFIGPPGPKAFRLWSLRSVAFNRASSPYHALGLADWSRRFKDHVGFVGSTSDFAAAYLKSRQQLEARYGQQSDQALASLARRQGAGFILAGSGLGTSGAIVPIKTDGRFALYRLADVPVVGLREAEGRER
jgi:hypothetical protein